MRHKNSGRRLGRKSPHRRAMYRNLAASLLVHETVRTTLPKAKELRRVVEPLITLAKEDSVSHRRLAFDRLRDDEAVGRPVQGARPALQEPAGRLSADSQDRLPRRRLCADGDRAAARSAGEGRRAEGAAHDGVSRSRREAFKPAAPRGRRAFLSLPSRDPEVEPLTRRSSRRARQRCRGRRSVIFCHGTRSARATRSIQKGR